MKRFYVLDLGTPDDATMNYAVMDRAQKNNEGRDLVYAAFVVKDHAEWFCDLMNNWSGPGAGQAMA